MSFIEHIIGREKVVDFWKQVASKLEKRDAIFQVSDFDYTLFSRDEQLEKIPDLQNNRGNLGPQYLFEKYGMSKFLEEYYSETRIPAGIIEKLNSSRDIIITAGKSTDFQMGKIRSLPELSDFRVIVTPDGESKIPELIRYIIFELRYIPKEIIVYEDRPDLFIKHKELIQSVLGCPVKIVFVEMDGNIGYSKLENI